jgi:hypothetical protein
VNKHKLTSQQSVFFQKNTKRREIERWIKDVNEHNKKSIYNLSWNGLHKELHKLGIKEFLMQYGYSDKRKLQRDIARSKLWQKKITLYDFEKRTEQELKGLLGNIFFDMLTRQPNFKAKHHKLSTIHYYMYHHSITFTTLSLCFASKQSFLNFFAQTMYVSEYVENKAQNLRESIESLREVAPDILREELACLYDKPLVENKDFLKYNYTLEELKLALESENIMLVAASLGGCSAFYVNKKLKTLSPVINVSVQDLKLRSLEELMKNTPILFWKLKLYQLFSGQIPLEQWATRATPLYRSCISWPFFTSQHTQNISEERDAPLSLHNPHSRPYS